MISWGQSPILRPCNPLHLVSALLRFSTALLNQDWLSLSPMPSSLLPEPWRTWLLDKGSLTQALKALSPNSFSVRLDYTGFSRASLSEAKTLGIDPREQVYVREVALCLNDIPVVMARSIIPRSTLTGPERQLLHLNNKPLGEFLFSHKHMRRGAIECKQGAIEGQSAWARRSIFYVNNKPLLVSEYFLPALLDFQ